MFQKLVGENALNGTVEACEAMSPELVPGSPVVGGATGEIGAVTVGLPLVVVAVVVVPWDVVDDGDAGAAAFGGAALVEDGPATDGTVTVRLRTGRLALPIVTSVVARIVARTLHLCLPLTSREDP
jgi:hypothetical protein